MRFSIGVVFCLGLAIAVWLAGACADFQRGPAADAAVEAPLVDDPVFENDVYPILQTRCEDCHSAGKAASFTRYILTGNAKMDRAMVVNLVTPGNPDTSLLLQRATNTIPHTGGERLFPGDPEYTTVRDWIANLPASP
jgi:hypothetical protein